MAHVLIQLLKTLEEHKKMVISPLDAMKGVTEDGKLAQFVALGMGRETTVGIEDSDICEAWKDFPGNQGIFDKIFDALSSIFGLYKSCQNVDEGVAIGSNYTLSSIYRFIFE